jgi:acyl-CoA thioester hydrolase
MAHTTLTMPLTHTRTFRVRFHECDAHGHLNNAYYPRYMQETAFDASAAAGYGLERYTAMQRHWLIRESCIDFLHPLRYNDHVQVKTWISDFRRVSSRRRYEFALANTGQVVAQAFTDWVFLDTATNQPASIPETLANDFFPEGVPTSFPARQPFPKSPPQPPGAFQIQRRVAWNDIDTMQHVNNAVYLNYLTECGFQAFAAFGWPFGRILSEGAAVFLRRLQIQYLQPALLDDDLEITTWMSDVRSASALRHYTILRSNDHASLVRAQSYSAWVNPDCEKPVRIPKKMLTDIAPMLVHNPPNPRAFLCPYQF